MIQNLQSLTAREIEIQNSEIKILQLMNSSLGLNIVKWEDEANTDSYPVCGC